MKKTKRLQLSRETIKKLSATEIRYAAGGQNNLSAMGICLGSEQNTACDACATEWGCW
jgi:hypothetical protein